MNKQEIKQTLINQLRKEQQKKFENVRKKYVDNGGEFIKINGIEMASDEKLWDSCSILENNFQEI